MATPTEIVAYVALFVGVGFLFLFINLLVGRLLRPSDPHPEKLEIYECGEPTIGSSFVQFDLRFYVVALIFLIFEVEVAFLFPLATVFGKATQLADPHLPGVMETATGFEPTAAVTGLYQELGLAAPALTQEASSATAAAAIHASGQQLAWLAFGAINVFFVILLVGFAYEWKTGAFDWVRSISPMRKIQIKRPLPASLHEEQSAAAP